MKKILLFIASATLVLAMLLSCNRDNLKIDIPSYIAIDSVILDIDTATQGTKTQNFSSVEVLVNHKKIGIFDIPARFPVLKEGKVDVLIRPWIKKSGVNDFKTDYFHIKNYIETITLKADEEVHIIPKFTYKEETKIYIEDFDGPGLMFHTSDSVNLLVKKQDPNNPNNQIGFIDFSLVDEETAGFTFFTKLELPNRRTAMYLEMDYKCNTMFGIGLLKRFPNNSIDFIDPFTIVKPKADKWNKMYIDIGEQIAPESRANTYDIFFYVSRNNEQGKKSEVYLDNIKILTF